MKDSARTEDTIAALCSGAGGAIAILRVSGPKCLEAAAKVWKPKGREGLSEACARKLLFGHCSLGGTPGAGEETLAVYMPGPRSYTGEDVVELHCHGGAAAPKRLLEGVLRCGVRAAEPGEFTRRAFINGRIDLTQAEAVADLIAAKSESALALAERQMAGALGRKLKELRAPLLDALAEIESRLDFAEENLDWQSPETLCQAIARSEKDAQALLASRRQGALLRDGARLTIAGRPNVGKSSLMNALLGYDRAIVSEIPGTTRDTVEERVSIEGIPVRLADTAGLRESADRVEALGVERSKRALAEAEIALWVLDASAANPMEELAQMAKERPGAVPTIIVWNKSDLRAKDAQALPKASLPQVECSALSGEGLEELRKLIAKQLWGSESKAEPEAAVSTRHAALLEDALPELAETRDQLEAGRWELAASSLRSALEKIGEVLGETAAPDVLDAIFSRFCIGK